MSEARTTEERRSFASLVGTLAHTVDKVLSPGDVAELRRMTPDEPGCAAFWKVLAAHIGPEEGFGRDDQERRWAVVLRSLAELKGLHRPGRRLGRTLAEGDLSEGRFLRLLRARDDALFDAVRVTVHLLASKALPLDAAGLARLVFSDGRRDRESVRRHIARDYYGNQKRTGD